MKISEILKKDKQLLSFEIFPPKKDGNIETDRRYEKDFVFGDGIDMWLRSQGDAVKVIKLNEVERGGVFYANKSYSN